MKCQRQFLSDSRRTRPATLPSDDKSGSSIPYWQARKACNRRVKAGGSGMGDILENENANERTFISTERDRASARYSSASFSDDDWHWDRYGVTAAAADIDIDSSAQPGASLWRHPVIESSAELTAAAAAAWQRNAEHTQWNGIGKPLHERIFIDSGVF